MTQVDCGTVRLVAEDIVPDDMNLGECSLSSDTVTASGEIRASVTVSNPTDAGVTATVATRVDGRQVATTDVSLAAGGSNGVRTTIPAAEFSESGSGVSYEVTGVEVVSPPDLDPIEQPIEVEPVDPGTLTASGSFR